jgi:hypothetical protein
MAWVSELIEYYRAVKMDVSIRSAWINIKSGGLCVRIKWKSVCLTSVEALSLKKNGD